VNISTLTRVKLLLGIPETEVGDDELLASLLEGVSATVEGALDRGVETKERTEYFNVDAGQQLLLVNSWPITSITSITENTGDRTFADDSADTTAVAATDYTFLPDEGGMGRVYMHSHVLTGGPRTVRIIYEGGMAETTDACVLAYPDLAQAVDLQSAFLFKRRNFLGVSGLGTQGGSVSFLDKLELLPQVKDTIAGYRRIGI
jgi:hypothetical protein